jgi:hypothetical protein
LKIYWYGRRHTFSYIAQGSVEEYRYYLILTKDLGYGDIYDTKLLLQEVSKLLEAYSRGILNSGGMKMNKRSIQLLLCLVLIISVFIYSGCSGKESEESGNIPQ